MVLTKKTIKNLTGGISQQPDANRHDNQCTNQVNFLSDPIKGLTKRTGTELVKSIKGTVNAAVYLDEWTGTTGHSQTSANIFTAVIPHPKTVEGQDSGRECLFSISVDGKMSATATDNGASAGIVDSAESLISPESVHAYMARNDHSNWKGHQYAVVTVADTTFVVNKAATITEGGTTEPKGKPRCIFFVKEGAYNAEYNAYINDIYGDTRRVRVKTSDGENYPTDSKTKDIIAALAFGLDHADFSTDNSWRDYSTLETTDSNGYKTASQYGLSQASGMRVTVWNVDGNSSAYNKIYADKVYVKGSVCVITTGTAYVPDYQASIDDSYGDTMTQAWMDVADTFSGLPLQCTNGYKLRIVGAPESNLDDYYVEFVASDTGVVGITSGVWQECLGDDGYDGVDSLKTGLTASRMPHILVPIAIGGSTYNNYQFKEAEWGTRDSGDDATNPHPDFVGKGINDIFFFQSRIGFCSGNTITMTGTNDPYQFFRTTASQLLPTDRLAIESNVNGHVRLNYAVPFSNQMVIFADRNQFIINYGPEGLAPGATSLTNIANYEVANQVRPVPLDNSIVFLQQKAGATDVYELYPTGSSATSFEAQSIAEQVPTLLAGDPVALTASALARCVIVQTSDDLSKLWVYKYYNKGRERIQSAWMEYDMNCTSIKTLSYHDQDCYLIKARDHLGTPTTDYEAESLNLVKIKLDNTADTDYSMDEWTSNIIKDGSFGAVHSGYHKVRLEDWLPDLGANHEVERYYTLGDNTLTCLDLSNSNAQLNTKLDATGLYVQKDFTTAAVNLVIGLPVVSEYEFSKQYLKTADSLGKDLMAVVDGRTTVKWCEVYLSNSQYMQMEVSYPGPVDGTGAAQRTTTTKTFSGNTVGSVIIGDDASETGKLRSVVASRNDLPVIKLKSDTYKTATITGASFELMLTSRLRNIN